MLNHKGYVLVREPSHPRANNKGYVLEHILVMEKILGRPILPSEDIHHINEKRHDNRPENLMLFKMLGSHRSFHTRLNAFKASGFWHWRKCQYCQKHDDPNNLYINDLHRHVFHKSCHSEWMKKYHKLRNKFI